jgi:hypothetical protein
MFRRVKVSFTIGEVLAPDGWEPELWFYEKLATAFMGDTPAGQRLEAAAWLRDVLVGMKLDGCEV